MEKSTFLDLAAMNMTEKHKEKNKLAYLPWSCAWTAIKTYDPLATYHPVKTEAGCLYHTDGRTCWVETSLTINGETQNETLAVMDNRNQSIPLDQITSTAVNKSVKRCLVKNAALFGLDLNLWEGEELSDEAKKRSEADAAALADAVKEIGALGSQLIDAGYSKKDVYAVVAKHNDGEEKPAKIADVAVAEAIKKEFGEMLSAKPADAKPEKKPAARKPAAKKGEDA